MLARGGGLRVNLRISQVLVNDDKTVKGLKMQDGSVVVADAYVLTMPVDVLKLMLPDECRPIQYFDKLYGLTGVPVTNIHMWFDTKLTTGNHLLFSRSPLLYVYAICP